MAEIDSTPLPRGLTKRYNGSWMLDKKLGGKRVRVSLGRGHTKTAIAKFKRKLCELTSRFDPILAKDNELSHSWSIHIESAEWPLASYRTSKNRAKSRGLSFAITFPEYMELLHASGGACQLSGVPFSFEKEPGARVSAFRPSLDRIHCADGYSAENCRFVCLAVNMALNDFGDKAFHVVASSYVLRHLIMQRNTAQCAV